LPVDAEGRRGVPGALVGEEERRASRGGWLAPAPVVPTRARGVETRAHRES